MEHVQAVHVLQRTRDLRHPLAHLARVKARRHLKTAAAAALGGATAEGATTLGLLAYGCGERAWFGFGVGVGSGSGLGLGAPRSAPKAAR